MALGDLQRTVGANLCAYRKERDLSQEAFAEVIGVHRTYMGGVERGERNLTLKSVEKIAEQLGVEALELLLPGDSKQLRVPSKYPSRYVYRADSCSLTCSWKIC